MGDICGRAPVGFHWPGATRNACGFFGQQDASRAPAGSNDTRNLRDCRGWPAPARSPCHPACSKTARHAAKRAQRPARVHCRNGTTLLSNFSGPPKAPKFFACTRMGPDARAAPVRFGLASSAAVGGAFFAGRGHGPLRWPGHALGFPCRREAATETIGARGLRTDAEHFLERSTEGTQHMTPDLLDFFLGQGGALAVAGCWIFFLQRQVSALQARLAQLEGEHRRATTETYAHVLEISQDMSRSLQRSEQALREIHGGNGAPSA